MPPRTETLAINDAASAREASPADVKPVMNMKSMGGMKHDRPATMPATAPAAAPGDHASHGGER